MKKDENGQQKAIYLVGGAVRDMLMGNTIQDRDYVAVGYSVDDFSHLQKVGKDFPVFITQEGHELALARRERKIAVGYGGFETDIENVSLEDDLMRRDLTINSIAYDEKSDVFIDPYGGQKDIQDKVLRHTSDAFVEDPLRVLRLARFQARFGHKWSIAQQTQELVKQMKHELPYLQADRVWKELYRVFEGPNTRLFFETLLKLDVLDVLFPSVFALSLCKENSKYHQEDSVFEHTMMVLDDLQNESLLLKLVALYHDIAKPYCYAQFGSSAGHERLEYVEPRIDMPIPKKLRQKMLFIVSKHTTISLLPQMRSAKIARFLESFKKDKMLLKSLLRFKQADNKGRKTEQEKEEIDGQRLLQTFDAMCAYSPKEWIDSLPQIPSAQMIQEQIHQSNVSSVKRYFKQIV